MFLVALPLAVQAQSVSNTPVMAAPSAYVSTSDQNKTYTNPGLNLIFIYPAELQPEDINAVMDRGHIAFYGTQPETDPQHLRAESCDKFLLAVSKTSDSMKGRVSPAKNGKSPVFLAAPGGSIVLDEVQPNCIPPKEMKNVDNLLAGIAIEGLEFRA